MESTKTPHQQKSKVAEIHHVILSEIEKAVSEGNVDGLEQLSNAIENAQCGKNRVVLEVYKQSENPLRSTNLIILACKYNRVKILEHLLSGKTKILNNLSVGIGRACVSPNDKDGNGHNAFYYAIRSGNIEVVDLLIKKWRGNYFVVHLEELESVISSSYEELKLKNVALAKEMEIFIETQIIDLRFFSELNEEDSISLDANSIKQRIELTISSIRLLQEESTDLVDEKFLFVLKFIVQNIHVLKRQLRSTYDRLPWEEIEFCSVCFVSSHTKQQEINLFYDTILNKNKILKYLDIFAKKLEVETENINNADVTKLADLPKLNRDKVIVMITGKTPEFKDLYNDFQQIRDVSSLKRINDCITLAVESDPKQKEGQVLIMRLLQVIGEHLKNTLESPKLSNKTNQLFLLSLPSNTQKIIKNLRNSLSHSTSLFRRMQIEASANAKFFAGILEDVKKVGEVISEILFNSKIQMAVNLLEKFVDSQNLEEMKDVARIFNKVDFKVFGLEEYHKISPQKLEKLVDELNYILTYQTDYEKKLFKDIKEVLNKAKKEGNSMPVNYFASLGDFKNVSFIMMDNEIPYNDITSLKSVARNALQNIVSQICPDNLKQIKELVSQIYESVCFRELEFNVFQVHRLILNIQLITDFGTALSVEWMEMLKDELNIKRVAVSKSKQKPENFTGEKHDERLTQKLSELQNVLNNNQLSGAVNNVTEQFPIYNTDKKLQTVIEMLVLDLMSILGSPKNHLKHNLHFLDDTAPVLIGKALRNHLAHHNDLVEMLPTDPRLALLLNARKITTITWTKNVSRIGKVTPDDPSRVSDKFQKDLSIITNQQRMFFCLENGDIGGLKSCLENGADLTARSVDLWSALHYATKGPSLETVKFILKENLQFGIEDVKGRTPLHIAAANGRMKTVEFLIKQKKYSVRDEDKWGRTPLHLAALNGHQDTVKVLLKYNSNTAALDLLGSPALFLAIKNNHVETTKLLLEKEVDFNLSQMKSGLTYLYIAAEYGHLDIVNLLLKSGANVNSRNDMQTAPLHMAALHGHLEIVRALISKGADVNVAAFNGCMPLHYAVETGQLKVAELLLEHGANVNCLDKTHRNTLLHTPLHYAAKDGHVEITKLLLEYNVNCNAVTKQGLTPLHLAVIGGNLQIAVMLLQRDANVNAKDVSGATPLYYAGMVGQSAIADLLLRHGAFVDARSTDNTTPLHVAALKGNKNVIEVLLENKANVDLENNRGQTALHFAAMNGNVDTLDLLIRNGAEVDVTAMDGITPLGAAASSGCEAAVDFLIKNNAKVNITGMYGMTPLYMAILGGNRNIVNLLIKYNAEVNAWIMGDCTLLHIAIESGHREIVEILLANGADVNAKSKEGTTPLCLAVDRNSKEMVEVLVKQGANIDGTDQNGTTPLSMAVLAGYRDIVDVLLKNNASVNATKGMPSPLYVAAMKGSKGLVSALIKKGAVVNTPSLKGETPLHAAVLRGSPEIVEVLLKSGADANIKSDDGTTPLLYAAAGRDNEMVELLVNHGADVAAKDASNRTALRIAVFYGGTDAVKTLLQRNRDAINARDDLGRTLLHVASQQSNLDVVKYLVEEGADLNVRNDLGSKPAHIAAMEGFKDTVDFFLGKGVDLEEPGAANKTLLHYAAMDGRMEVVEYLISKGADVNIGDCNGSTPLHVSVSHGFTNVAEVLLKNGAIYEALDNLSRTPLHVAKGKAADILSSTEKLFEAVKRNSCEDAERYIKAGAFLDAKNKDRSTPLHYAAWKGFKAISKLLLDNRADPNVLGKQRLTPLHYAVKYSHFKIVMALLTYGAIYGPVSAGGKTPLDWSQDRKITDLLVLVDESFRYVKNGHSKVINVLEEIKDMDTLKAVMNACDRDRRTLLVAAMRCDFPKVERLKEVAQGDVSSQMNIAKLLRVGGRHAEALSILRPAYEKRKAILGPTNPGTLDLQILIAQCLYEQGAYQDALNMNEDILEKQKATLGLNHKDTLSTRGGIALIFYRQGRDAEAFEIYQDVYAKQLEILGPDDSDTLDSLFHMALLLDRQGKYEEALRANREVFAKRRAQLGPYNPATIRAQNNIAIVLSKKGDYKEAMEIFEGVYENKRTVLGENHADTLTTLHNIAGLHTLQKKYDSALKLYVDVVEKGKNALGPDHPQTLSSQHGLADVLFKQGKYVSALKAYEECYDGTLAIYGPHHPSVLDISVKMNRIKKWFMLGGSSSSGALANLQNDMNVAASNGDLETVVGLLMDGADVNDSDVEGRTPLHYAASNGHLNVVTFLLKSGADISRVTHKGNTPLHLAVSKNHVGVVEALLGQVSGTKLGDLVNARTLSGGNSALHVAARNGDIGLVRCLLKHGAIYDTPNSDGKRPVDLSAHPRITNLLESIEDSFGYIKSGDGKILSLLYGMEDGEVSAMANARDKDGNTLLKVAMVNRLKDGAKEITDLLT